LGDALVVAFTGAHDSPAQMLVAAVRCGHRLASMPTVFTANRSVVRIELRLGT
jgi:hypothetical protein